MRRPEMHSRPRRRALALAALVLLPLGARAADVTVFAAASLSDALTEIAGAYERSGGDRLAFNFGASSTLALQIRQGAPADVFLSADESTMDGLAQRGLIIPETRRRVLSNSLVIVIGKAEGAPVSAPGDLARPAITRIALAEPETVPAGVYAKAYLTRVGLWEKVAAKVVPTENVRACLAAVESGDVDAGIVYKTDALISRRVKIAYEIPAGEGPRISYPVAVLKESSQPEAGRRFAVYLESAEARAVFTRHGFRATP